MKQHRARPGRAVALVGLLASVAGDALYVRETRKVFVETALLYELGEDGTFRHSREVAGRVVFTDEQIRKLEASGGRMAGATIPIRSPDQYALFLAPMRDTNVHHVWEEGMREIAARRRNERI